MAAGLLYLSLALNLAVLAVVFLLLRRSTAGADASAPLARIETLDQSLAKKFTDLAVQLAETRGNLNAEMTQKLSEGIAQLRASVDSQLTAGRAEQSSSLGKVTANLEVKFDQLTLRQSQSAQEARNELAKSLDAVRAEVDRKLNEITGQVQQKLDQNIKEGFAHFQQVQQSLQSAEEQLRNVGALGTSIHDLNNLLRLPHLRGKFGEASLERLLADFLPAHMFSLQAGPQNTNTRADAMIHFPECDLPIDAKFPREQVLALFEADTATDDQIAEARHAFERVMKEQAKRVKTYIQPENRTTDLALMYLPSETLYMEAVRNRELAEELHKMKVFPVSPNTLMVTLQAVQMVHKWYKVQGDLLKTQQEIYRAQRYLRLFDAKFEVIGKTLEKAQEAYQVAGSHFGRFKREVTGISGVESTPELPFSEEDENGNKMAAKA